MRHQPSKLTNAGSNPAWDADNLPSLYLYKIWILRTGLKNQR
jgi:hypothetical protein